MAFTSRLGSILLAVFSLAVAASPAGASQSVKTGGTGAAVGTIEILAQEYRAQNPSFSVSVVAGLGTSGGIKAVTAGALDFALVGRRLKQQEREAGLVSIELGRTPFLVVTNKTGVQDISKDQLASLIGSSSPTWSDGAPVRLVLRPAADSDTELLGAFSPAIKIALADAQRRGGMVRAITDQESATESERLPGSLGTSSLALLRSEERKLMALSIDGIAPTLANFASGVYPHGKTLSIVTQGTPGAETAGFLAFIASDKGRQILMGLGYLVSPPQ